MNQVFGFVGEATVEIARFLRRNPFVNQVFGFGENRDCETGDQHKSRNPFVNQVFGFTSCLQEARLATGNMSQSLRESGLWFPATFQTGTATP